MGISDDMTMEELGNTKTHLLTGGGEELASVAVDVLACGPLTIITPPDHPEDETRDQQAFFMRAKMLNGDEHELMFHMEHAGLIYQMVSDTMNNHMLQALDILDAPQHIRDEYDVAMEREEENGKVRLGIIAAAEAAMMTRDMKDVPEEDAKRILDHLLRNPAVKEILDDLFGDEEDDAN